MSLFGNLGGQSSQQQQPSGSLFGGTSTTNQQQSGATAGALFGNNPTSTAQQQQTNPAGSSLFGQPQTSTTQPSLFGSTNPFQQSQQQPQQQMQASSLSGALGQGLTATTSNNPLHTSTQRDLTLSRLSAAGMSTRDNAQKTVAESLLTLHSKWSPNSASTTLQTYLYNHVNPAYAPFYQPNSDDDLEKWERALSDKPGEGYVPVLCRGFGALGARIELQAKTVNEMRMRLHEMNNALTAVMRKHQLELTARLAAAKRRHTQLSQQTLRLAVKTQVLRNRGYNLDAAEEGLRKQIQALEHKVVDPGFTGREEEIWARMVGLRERARWLEAEGKKVGDQVLAQGGSNSSGQGGSVPEEVIVKTKKVLSDYDGQLALLSRELAEVEKDFREWQEAR